MKDIWYNSVYSFRVPFKDETKLQEIFVDVTGSAPTFNEVFETMTKVFNDLLKSDECKNVTRILDFGAAKFRNTLFFLKKGKKTSAVEFEKLVKSSNQAKKILKECKNYDNYENVIFPHPFIEHNAKYDLCLLVNVLPVMPVFAERLLVLQVLHEKTNENGHVLWYAQPNATVYREIKESNKQNLGDGIWLKADQKYKTFFRYHPREEVNEMMALSGFEFVRKIPASGNDVMLYKKIKYNLFSGIIDSQKILNLIPFDESIKDPQIKPKIVTKNSGIKVVIPNPPELSMENLYIDALVSFDPGPDYPEHYHRLASQIINRLFRGHLRNMELQQPMDGRNKFIDTIYRNAAEKGFFYDLSSKLNIKCPYIVVEAKNYNYDPNNPEFDQLSGRLTDTIGKFGILVCRKVENVEAMQKKCKTYLNDGKKHIIVLTDEDLIYLLECYKENDFDAIDDFMHEKIKPLIFG